MKTADAVITWTGAATKSMAATITSDPFPMKNMTLMAVAVTVSSSSSPVGTIKLQACCDTGVGIDGSMQGITGLSNWVDITSASQAITADGTTLFDLRDVPYRWVRVVYTRSSGSGTMAVHVNAKGSAP